MAEQLAQAPDAVVTKTADTFLQQGVLGAVCIVLLGVVFFGAKWLKGCLEASAERQVALVTVIQEQKAAGQAAAAAMAEMARRLETLERALERAKQ